MPSLFEGLANAALEGCAAGLPAVLSHAANVDGIVAPGRDRLGGPPPGARARSCARSKRPFAVSGRSAGGDGPPQPGPRGGPVRPHGRPCARSDGGGLRRAAGDRPPAWESRRLTLRPPVPISSARCSTSSSSGSGFGGGDRRLRPVARGADVLLVERGGWVHRDETDWNGRAILLDGRYKGPSPVLVQQNGARAAVETFSNEVVGGNSIFFGGAALRLRDDRFRALAGQLCRSRAALRRRGSAAGNSRPRRDDPCEPPRSSDYPFPPPRAHRPAQRIFDAARAIGLRPFQLPIAINHAGAREPRCLNCFTCDGFPCRIGAKNDVTQTALRAADPGTSPSSRAWRRPACSTAKAGWSAWRPSIAEADGGRRLAVESAPYLLAAGAIGTPALMLRSGLERARRLGRARAQSHAPLQRDDGLPVPLSHQPWRGEP